MNEGFLWWWLAVVMIPAAVFSGYRLWVLDKRARVQRARLEAFRGTVILKQTPRWWEQFGKRFAPIVGNDQQRLLKTLVAAGFKHKSSLTTFIAIKVVAAFSFVILTWLLLESRGLFSGSLIRLPIIGIGLLLGWRLPEIALNYLVRRRRSRIEQGIPDALDLLVVCAEAGLSLNQGINEVSHQLRLSNSEVAAEFATTSAEMRILPDFAQALDNLVERTGLTNLRGLVATLKQSLQFGTPLAESLRVVAGEMRAERHALMEERAARLPVLLAMPMMAFILPCLLMIIGTPVVLRIIDAFKNLHFGGFHALN